ncbi:hypothetical protein BH11ARM2_BH11ARM2_19620 [soil metagenome]
MDSYLRLGDDKGVLRTIQYDDRFFGTEPRFRFEKDSGRKNNDLLIGLAVLAAGAIAATQNHGGQEYGYDIKGDGTLRYGNGDRYRIESVKFDLSKSDNNFLIDLRGPYAVEIKGKWDNTRRGYSLNVKEMTVDGNRRDACGRGTVELRSDGKTPGYFTLDANVSSSYRSATLTFDPDNR